MGGEVLAHDVFICHATKDKAVAEAICAVLESHKIACWIAPRNVLEGTLFAEQIVDAINACKVFVLLYSSSSNDSPHVMREVSEAGRVGKTIIPFRIEDVPPAKALNYYIGPVQWLDATGQPLDKSLDRLVERARSCIGQGQCYAGPKDDVDDPQLKPEIKALPQELPLPQEIATLQAPLKSAIKIHALHVPKSVFMYGAIIIVLISIVGLALASGALWKSPGSGADHGLGIHNNTSMTGTGNLSGQDSGLGINSTNMTGPLVTPGAQVQPTQSPDVSTSQTYSPGSTTSAPTSTPGVSGASSTPTPTPAPTPTTLPGPDGTLRITANEQAVPMVDGVWIGGYTVPGGTVDFSLKPGTHHLVFTRQWGYADYDYGMITIVSGQVLPISINLIVTPTPVPDGTLRVTANEQAVPMVDGVWIGGYTVAGTVDFSIKPGTYHLVFVRQGYADFDYGMITIVTGQVTPVNINL